MKCPVCGAMELVQDTRDQTFTYKGETTVITFVTGEFCPACDEAILDAGESERVMNEMRAFSWQTGTTMVVPSDGNLQTTCLSPIINQP